MLLVPLNRGSMPLALSCKSFHGRQFRPELNQITMLASVYPVSHLGIFRIQHTELTPSRRISNHIGLVHIVNLDVNSITVDKEGGFISGNWCIKVKPGRKQTGKFTRRIY